MPSDRQLEVPLLGGTANRGQVVRIGDTVRRPQRPTSAATHVLLRHLEDVGFQAAPKFLGIDSQDREVLSYIPGHAVTAPYPAWALTDEALISVAELLRRYHDAVAGLGAGGDGWPSSPPSAFTGELISHNDPNLDNVVFRGGRAVALIDFDLASPGSRLWDVACASRLWVPLRPEVYIGDARRGRILQRLRLFVDCYRLPEADRGRLVEAVRQNHTWCYDIVRTGAEQGHPAFSDYWDSERAVRTYQWYLDNGPVLHAALAGG